MPVLSNFLGISVAAILGVLTRVYVNSLFGPERLEITSPEDTLFYDLPSNILGCFFLGAFNSLKSHISIPSLLGLALSTGYAGSVTSTLCFLPSLFFSPFFSLVKKERH